MTAVFQSSPVPKDGCNVRCPSSTSEPSGFNPHPSRRTGATVAGLLVHPVRVVSILTRPEGRVQPMTGAHRTHLKVRFNPHPSRRTGATRLRAYQFVRQDVSILTRPEGRVQLSAVAMWWSISSFQSSPVPKDGCNGRYTPTGDDRCQFQSSPVPKDGCNPRFADSLPFSATFQSSPVPKDGCNACQARSISYSVLFQSSPVPKDGCNPPGQSL